MTNRKQKTRRETEKDATTKNQATEYSNVSDLFKKDT